MKTKWTGHAHNGNWFDARNWQGGVPVAGEVTSFTDGHAWTISLAGTQAATAGAMTVLGDAIVFTGGTLDLMAAQPRQGLPQDLSIGGGGSVTVSSNATLTAPYNLTIGSSVSGTETAGSLIVQGTVSTEFLNLYDGTVQIAGPAAHLALLGGGDTAMVFDGMLTVSAGGTLDAGPNSLADNNGVLLFDGMTPDVVNVTGAGSSLVLAGVTFTDDAGGTLNVLDGGTVSVDYVTEQNYGDENLVISGAGSSLTAARGISVGSNTSLSGQSLTVLDSGTVNLGSGVLGLRYGNLTLDASAHLVGGPIYAQTSVITAVAVSGGASPGRVVLSQNITLDSNQGNQGQYDFANYAASQGGAVLDLKGVISSQNSATLVASSGSVVLANGANTLGALALSGATLEIAATGAAGAGVIGFMGGEPKPSVLQLDSGVVLANTIAGFSQHDTIDLRGFAFANDVTESFSAGTLTVMDSSGTTTLSLSGSYTVASFAVSSDHHGGTSISFVHT